MSANGERSAFVRGKQERGLRLTLDLDALNRSDELEALLELGRHEEIEVTTTKPVGFSTISVGSEVSNRDMVEVQTQHPSGDGIFSGVWPASQWLRFADEHCRATGTAPSETQKRFLLAGAVVECADALVLQDTHFVHDVARRANPLTVDQAAALAGLFLRSRGHEEVALWNKGREKTGLGWQYFVVGRTILPEAWRWWSACVATGQSPSGVQTMGTAQAVLDRFPRCIRARDEVMYRCLVPVRQSDQESILYHLDALLLMLSGALDSTALVANDAHSIGFPPWEVGWRRARWRGQLRSGAPGLHGLTEPGGPVRAVIDLVAEARNTIHGEPLRGVHYQSGSEQKHLVRLPASAGPKIVEHAKTLGGASHWGINPDAGGMTLLDPLRFVQVIIPFAAAALNSIMAATEVERLPQVDPSELLLTAPASDIFEPRRVRRLQLLLGLST